ncbi:hypothetical protein O6H91_20G057200 [Diphasiastrum complanatum]|uniref:Uncharacterized protein n=1 Tax=Diphasiastrum complanatum TaxID=34168 RepID=A0ACC2AQR0_DIPCM|nr:hypothetical protein O6H91_20G057200 [Diphasiastrum complanatum]
MKLFVEVELSPDEIPMATELLRTLRQLTDHVKTRDLVKLLHSLVLRIEDGLQLDIVASEISDLVSSNMTSETVFDDLLTAFTRVIFNPELVMQQKSVVPFMLLIPRLQEPAKSHLCSSLIPKVLKHLTVKRPVEASRMDFFAQAEAFAALVNLQFIPVTGAVSTIITLLRKPENRSAAITMLGKTVELCLQQLNDKCDPAILAELRSELHSVTEDVFKYDVNYIEESMGWSLQIQSCAKMARMGLATIQSQGDCNQKGRVDPLLMFEGLYATDSYHGHQNTIFALSFDDGRNQIVSGGKDGLLIVWSADGKVIERLTMARHYACSMDINCYHQALLVCGVTKEEHTAQVSGNWISSPPCIFQYGPVGRSWKEHAVLSKDSSKLVSCIKALGGAEHSFVTGETVHSTIESGVHKLGERVCYYDMHSASTFAALQPVRQYAEHEDLITCISLFQPNQNIFMSGSRDCTVRVWDRRVDRSIGVGKTGQLQAHDGMITCIDASDMNMILSAGMDALVHRWDFRTLANQVGNTPISSLHLDDSAILKIALGGMPGKAAVSTFHGLYYVDFSNPRPLARLAEPFLDGRRVGRYHDLKWATGNSLLYAAGDDMRIDSYALR